MERSHLTKRRKQGIAIGLVLIVVIVSAVLLTALLVQMIGHSRRVGKSRSVQTAAYLAEAGLAHGLDRFLTNLAGGGGFLPKITATLPEGAYEVLAVQETAAGSLGQIVVHVVAQGVARDGSSAGCVRTYEVYAGTATTVIPIGFCRFDRPLDLDVAAQVDGLLYGDWAVKRKERLTRMILNADREMALTEDQYRDAVNSVRDSVIASGTAIHGLWDEVVSAIVQKKIAAPTP